MLDDEKLVHIDASTFQRPLETIAEVLAQKVKREAPKLLSAPPFVAEDLHVLVRQAIYTYNLLFYLNADERRENDHYWRKAYSIVTLPLNLHGIPGLKETVMRLIFGLCARI